MFNIHGVFVSILPAAAIAIQLLVNPAVANAQSHSPALVVQPTMNSSVGTAPLRDACLNPNSWPTGFDRLDFFGNAYQFFEQWTNDTEVAQCFTNLRNAGKALVVGTWSLRPFCTTAQACWNDHSPQITRLMSLNPPSQVFLEIDEPVTHGGFDYSKAVAETVEYIRLARLQFPGLGIFLAEAYPAQSISTLTSFYNDVHYGVLAATGTGIQYAMIDHDWNASNDIGAIEAIANSVRANDMQAAVAFWDASPTLSWYDGLMSQGLSYRNYGFEPDAYYVSNWTGSPTTTIPEANSGTFMRSVRDFSNTFLPYPTSVYGLQPNESLAPGQQRTSVDGRFTLIYQADGNLVLYGPGGYLWATFTDGTIPSATWMQGDGNLVVYRYDPGLGQDVDAWASNTGGSNGAYLVVQSDGNLVIYNGRWPIWSSNTNWY